MGTHFDLLSYALERERQVSAAGARQPNAACRLRCGARGFIPYPKEWWHFTLHNEPFPNSYFDFPVK